jgi:hypothetical protein
LELAVLDGSLLLVGHVLDMQYIEALSFPILCHGHVTFELWGGDRPEDKEVLFSYPVDKDTTIQIQDKTALPRFIRPIIKRDKNTIPVSMMIEMELAQQTRDYGIEQWLLK